MEDIMNILKPLEEWGLLIKGISKLIKNETKEQKGGFLSLLLGTLAAKILGNALAGKSKNRSRWGSNKSKQKLLMSTHPLSNFEIQKCYQKEPKFNGVYARNKLSKIKDGGIYNKSWWVWINRNSLDSIIYECWKCNILR